MALCFFFSSRRRHTRWNCDWSSDVCSSDLAKPGPKGPRKAGRVHDRVLALRADGHSVTEIAAALHAEGTPVSAQTVWTILDAEGIGRLVRDDTGRRGTPARLDPVKATTLSPSSWPA